MKPPPARVFLDTNVFLIGLVDPDSPEARILEWAGIGQDEPGPVEAVASDELFEQIRRVAKRLQHKDWAGELLARIWQQLRIRYVLPDAKRYAEIEATGLVPGEDVGVYLTASAGQAECFVSANHELIRALAAQTGEFECLLPEAFVKTYLDAPAQ